MGRRASDDSTMRIVDHTEGRVRIFQRPNGVWYYRILPRKEVGLAADERAGRFRREARTVSTRKTSEDAAIVEALKAWRLYSANETFEFSQDNITLAKVLNSFKLAAPKMPMALHDRKKLKQCFR